MKYKETILKTLTSIGFELNNIEDFGYDFKYGNTHFVFVEDEEDDHFLRIAIPHIYTVTPENRNTMLEAIHKTSLVMKYSKVSILYKTSVWVLYEHYLVTDENIQMLLEYIIKLLLATRKVFYQVISDEDFVHPRSSEEDEDDDKLDKRLTQLDDNLIDELNN